MKNTITLTITLLFSLLLMLSTPTLASESENKLQIHVHYQQASDSWLIQYKLPKAVERVSFARQSNFDRTQHYQITQPDLKWQQEDGVLSITAANGKKFTSFSLAFDSFYGFILKDYSQNVQYSDGSVLFYTNHLSLSEKLTAQSEPIFDGTRFYFYSPKTDIVFSGKRYKHKASWDLAGDGTYIYFGTITPIENDNMIAVVDPALPKWVWQNTQTYFPKLFDYYAKKLDQPLNFKPVVFFNYAHLADDFANYEGGTLAGLVQLSVNGKRWQNKDSERFNQLFHFLAHESAHFWNGQMYAVEDHGHAWLHEGGADAFANFAMLEFGFIDAKQWLQKFEESANQCLLNKEQTALNESAKLQRYKNYYSCGAVMALASHYQVQATNPSLSLFDIWRHLFAQSKAYSYNQSDYFNVLNGLIGNDRLAKVLGRFSDQRVEDNLSEIETWFEGTVLKGAVSTDYPSFYHQHWGKEIIIELMRTHCSRISLSYYDDYIKTYPIENCKVFDHDMEIQFVDGVDLLKNGGSAYQAFKAKCQRGGVVNFADRAKQPVAQIRCLDQVGALTPYIKLTTE
ncbi:hypothetical protein CWB89_12175 [Pseudoalteromonas piscicida]|uniref:Peptidase M1 membrane alanine aminopeptidase domain-containing protein n=1 Tax=Pseudoalteromonas piscicida TaxID=43662 RepID=A0AAQ2IU66_PSEO7|nr:MULTISPECIES: hypothetical protein [Pseudoalteromonas]KJY92494.1 hypothetical protein TW75_02020 [Pseudoalteromonas piscicida]TMN38206.1 hypothetical protein CWB95_14030 [Pseudoalteromonas piscicida]TMN39523.1 hypothetical protein CWB94_11420 [Pseudoalteromonas piscicida]TMN50296.1 hypothetical protein CWB91_14925 [Pseudoalteromonas piscicida]TMN52514.1 hypothetical protein CWB93_16705 [Pseudoalteromonas piscicida]